MHLVIDSGNTFTKIVIFNNRTIVRVLQFRLFTLKSLQHIFSTHQITASILSSVGTVNKDVTRFLKKQRGFVLLNQHTLVPLKILYKTPETLGTDRIASMAGAARLFPRKNVLVIDAGTCIKYDMIDKHNRYNGGSISPGLDMRFKALHQFTGRLPLIHASEKTELPGRTTRESILTGVQQGILYEMEGFIRHYRKKFPLLKIILTGGDAGVFAGLLKSSIFTAPNLIPIGLNEILIHHAENN